MLPVGCRCCSTTPPGQARKGRFLVVTRPEDLNEKRTERLADHPTLTTIRAFMIEFYGLFDGKPRPAEAERGRETIATNASYLGCTLLAGALNARGDKKKFAKVCVFLQLRAARDFTHI